MIYHYFYFKLDVWRLPFFSPSLCAETTLGYFCHMGISSEGNTLNLFHYWYYVQHRKHDNITNCGTIII